MAVIPKYYQIKTDIRQKIEEGHYKVKEVLPSELCLQEKYGVSRITVRKALDDLYAEGLIYKVQGKGTFVRDLSARKINLVADDTSCCIQITNCGYKATRTILRSEVVTVDSKSEEGNVLIPGQRYFLLERVFEGDGIPIIYEEVFYLYELVNGIEKHDFNRESITQILGQQYDFFSNTSTMTKECVFSVALPDKRLNKIMKLDKAIPLMKYRYQLIDKEKGCCVKYNVSHIRSDILPLSVTF